MQSTDLKGSFRASLTINPSKGIRKYSKLREQPSTIKSFTSEPTTRQSTVPASKRMEPAPQKGSRTRHPDETRAKLTMHRASLGGIVEGWRKGRFAGVRSRKLLAETSAIFTPKNNSFPMTFFTISFVAWIKFFDIFCFITIFTLSHRFIIK